MASLSTILNWFKTGLKPTQDQFQASFSSFRHKDDKVPIVDVDGIDDLLATKADAVDLKLLQDEELNLQIFKSQDEAYKALEPNKKFKLADNNFHGIVSPNNSIISVTKQ